MRAIAFAVLMLVSPAAAQREAASFLKITPGARPTAMGQAYTAVADDVDALNTNPAGLGWLPTQQAAFQHAELFAGTRYDFAGFARPVEILGGVAGFSLGHLSQPSLDGRDTAGNPTGSFSAGDTVVTTTYGRRLSGSSAVVGASLKYIHSTLADVSAQTYAVDLGVQRPFYAFARRVRVGASVRNLGPGIRFASETDRLPLALALGSALEVSDGLSLALDLSQLPYEGQTTVSIGTEYALLSNFALRSGYQSTPSDRAGADPISGLGIGFGLRLYKSSLNYAFSPHGALGTAQRLSLATRW